MSCCNNGKITKKKVMVFSLIGTGIIATSYITLTGTNIVGAVALPVVLAFAACPAMCAAIGGSMWIANRFKKGKYQKINSNKVVTQE
jgi:hypothetical protein